NNLHKRVVVSITLCYTIYRVRERDTSQKEKWKMDKELRQSMEIITEEFLELVNEAGYDEREQEKFNYFVISKSLAELTNNEYLPIVKAILEFNYDFIAK